MLSMFVFLYLSFCCLVGVFGDEVKSVSVMEGDSVTLQSNDTDIQTADLIEWRFGPQETLIARINIAAKTVLIYPNVLDGRFKDRLQVNNQTGDINITDINTQHTGLYQLTITSEQNISSYRFNVTVYAFCFCCCYGLEAVIRLALSALVGVATVAVLVYDIRSRKNQTLPSDNH